MSVYHHDRQPQGTRLPDSPGRTRRRPLCDSRATSYRPRLEWLERRVVLSPTIFTVDSTGNGTSGSGTSGTLPYVISQANTNANTAGSEIEFDSSVFNSSSPQTITLAATLVLTETAGPELIDGPGAGIVTVSGGGAVGVFEVDSGVTASLSGVTISGGSTIENGGGLYNNGTATLTDCTISGNFANNFGGGVDNQGSATLTNCTVSGNSGRGGGLANSSSDATLTLTNCTVSGNSGSVRGGGIDNEPGGTITLTNCTVSGNSTGSDGGGGLYAGQLSTTMLTNCTVSDNSSSDWGGGIESSGSSITLTNCTVSGNSAEWGGGVATTFGGTTTLTNCTFSGNSARSEGGGLFGDAGATNLTNCTVSGNFAYEFGGGLYNADGSNGLTLQNTIVAGNTGNGGSASDIRGLIFVASSSSYNLIGTGGSGGMVDGVNGNIVGVSDPLLAPLGNYGGPTQTIALLPGSSAIDAGNTALVPAGITTDQRGFARIVDGTVDIGAFEHQSVPLVVNTTGDGIDVPPGTLSLRGAVDLADLVPGGATITFDPTVFATGQTITLTQGQLDLSNTSGTEAITGPAAGVTVSAGGLSRVFQVDSGVTATFSALTISGGSTTGSGGGLENYGTATLTDCTISGNSALNGGGVYSTGNLTVSGATFTGNTATASNPDGGEGGGGIDSLGGTLVVSNSTFTANAATGGAGGAVLHSGGSGSITGCTLSDNQAGSAGGGGIAVGSGSLTIVNTSINDNSSAYWGGGLLVDAGAGLTAENDMIDGDSASTYGGGIENLGTTTFSNTTFASDVTYYNGGGISNNGALTATGCTFSEDYATGSGGGYFGITYNGVGGLATINNCTFSNNSAIDGGGGGLVNYAVVMANDCTFTDNYCLYGGGVYNANNAGATSMTADDCTFTGNSAAVNGGGLDNYGSLMVEGSTFTGNSAANGGGLFNFYGATLTVAGSTFTGNSAPQGGGLFNMPGAMATVDDSTFDGNRADNSGGGLFNGGHIDVLDSGFTGNTAGNTGGAVDNSGSGSISGCKLSDNSAGSYGGGISVDSGALTIGNNSIDDNSSGYWGAGIVVKVGAGLTADSDIFDGDYVNAYGGGLENFGTTTISNSTFTDDGAYYNGGGVANNGSLIATGDVFLSDYANNNGGGYAGGTWNAVGGSATITNCTFANDSAGYGGGGLASYTAAVTVSGSTFSSDHAGTVGGAITLYSGSLTVELSTVSENSAPDGGGLSNNPGLRAGGASLTVVDCTVSGNSAAVDGGGLENQGTATLTACTISGNSAAGNGGGADNESPATLTLTACTISGNSAAGGGLYNYGSATATLTDTIVAGNTGPGGPDDIGGSQASQVTGTYNLIGTGGSGGIAGGSDGNIVLASLTDLGLAPLGDYGGPTETMALLPGSAAIGAGTDASGVTTDQRGFPLDTPPDIGAFQTQANLVVNTTIDGTGSPSGDLSLRQAINLANALDVAETITFDPIVFATPQTITLTAGQLELSDTGGTVTISGPAAGVTISGGGMSRVFQVDSGVTAVLSGLTISGGSTTGDGGGVYDDGGTITLIDCTLSGNSAAVGGAICTKRGTIGVSGCTLFDNSATDEGGALYSYDSTTTLTDCTISGGSADVGGSICTKRGTIGVSGCTLYNNSATDGGGGLYSYDSATTLTDCTISGSSADVGGAVYTKRGTLGVTGCTVANNSAGSGGGMYLKGTATFDDTIVAGNTGSSGASDVSGPGAVSGSNNLIGVGGSGGLVNGTGGNLVGVVNPGLAPLGFYGGPTETIALLPDSPAIGAGTTESGITTDQRGFPIGTTPDIGAFDVQTGLVVNTTLDGTDLPPGDLSLRQAINLANVLAGSETITFDPTVFATAQTITLTAGQLELSDASGTETIMGPTAGVRVSGGGLSRVFQIDSGVTASISSLSITDGLTNASGGGLENYGTATLPDCTLSGNSAGDSGGGLDNEGSATLTDCTFIDNSALNNGGAIHNGGNMVVSDSTFTGNTASTSGGAVDNYGGPLTLTTCTLSGNSASSNGGGLNNDGGTATLTDCTLSGNSAQYGGGLASSGTAMLWDTIVAGNTALAGGPSDIGGSEVTGSYNLIGTGGSGGITGASDGNIVLASLTSLGLAPLGDYGGPAETMALLPGSPAIGAGKAASGVTTDERGAPRPASGAVDIGAFQDQGYTLAVSSGSPQITLVSQAFSAPLVVLLTEDFAGVPLPGVTINFTAPTSGASATLSAGSAVTDASGLASVTATANASAGIYAVTASATGVRTSASFSLSNQTQPSFSGLTNQTITYGSTITITGKLAAGSQAPAGEKVAITFDGVTKDAAITSTGSFSVQFTRADVAMNASSTAYNVTFDYQSDGAFLAAGGSSELTIDPASLTITAVGDTKVYDGTTTSSETPIVGTLYNGDTVTGLTEAFTSKNVLGANGSTLVVTGYTINDGDGGKDYRVTTQTAAGTISPVPLIVRANNVSTVYGSALPALTYTITGFVDGDSSNLLTGEPVIATTAGPGADAGIYPITIAAGTLVAENYSFTAADLVAGTLTVTSAPLVITAVSTSMFAGQPAPALTVVYTGFKNGDTPASLTSPPIIRSAASPSVAPGSYTITASGASSPNYTISYVPGTLTVILAPATVEDVSIQKFKLSKHKTVQGIVLQFSEALDSADAQNVSAYTLATVPKNKKQKSKPVQLSSAGYNPSAFTVTLFTRKTLALNPPIDLRVKAASLLDALGRELDGNDSGQSGANFTAVLSKAGTSVTSARAMSRIGGLSSHAVDAVLGAGLRAGR
jgi:parallel beta-helix repeat protein